MIGDFNAKFKDYCSIDITSFEGSGLDFLTSQIRLSQIIKELTYLLDNSSSCIDLIFTFLPNMVIDSGVHASLHSNCHHQIIFSCFYLDHQEFHFIYMLCSNAVLRFDLFLIDASVY